ncbi:MAG: GNAT family N-acetyltransferase [Candidatus Hydrogenedentales bacterium]
MPFDPQPVVLEGTHVRLEPLTVDHAEALFAAADHPEVWRFLRFPRPQNAGDMHRFIETALANQAAGGEIPFATVHRESGRPAGSTRLMDIRREHRALEIGWTWIGKDYQRSAVNTEAKFLMLRHAFETLSAVRVCLKADARNERSLRAIERIGATREGVLRNHMTLLDGYVRDSVYFSIIDREWPAVKARLETMLART